MEDSALQVARERDVGIGDAHGRRGFENGDLLRYAC